MSQPWCEQALDALLAARQGAAWGYRAAAAPCVEPTALASLALLAHQCDFKRAARDAADWLAGLQQPSGALGVGPQLPAPRWPTSLALLAWQAQGSHAEQAARACNWLLTTRGDESRTASGTPFEHDPRIPGWPWVEGTQAWLEPTAWAVLALSAAGLAPHPRVLDGQRLLRDRALRSGGWNYGNTRVFGADLRPQPAPTGLALLALAGVDEPADAHIERACRYLEHALSRTRAAQSLCFGLLGLRAFGVVPAAQDQALADARERSAGSVIHLAWLLLASAPQALAVLGVHAERQHVGTGHANDH
jgi:hypothetical protein